LTALLKLEKWVLAPVANFIPKGLALRSLLCTMLSFSSLQASYRALLAAGLTLSLAGGVWLGAKYAPVSRQSKEANPNSNQTKGA
jgi:hypothetical protein